MALLKESERRLLESLGEQIMDSLQLNSHETFECGRSLETYSAGPVAFCESWYSVSFLRRLELPRLTLPITLKALLTTNVALLRVPISSMFFFSVLYVHFYVPLSDIWECFSNSEPSIYAHHISGVWSFPMLSRKYRGGCDRLRFLSCCCTAWAPFISKRLHEIGAIMLKNWIIFSKKKKIKTRRKFHLPHHIEFSQFSSFSHIFAASKKKR